MTEAEWLERAMPGVMLRFLGDRASPRKLRLFKCTCADFVCRSLLRRNAPPALAAAWAAVDEPSDQSVVEAAGVTDSAPNPGSEEYHFHLVLESAVHPSGPRGAAQARRSIEALAVELAKNHGEDTAAASQASRTAMASFIRDLFGNPFRPVILDPSWLTSTVTTLARQMYDSRDFGPMPILADALQDVGCNNADVLSHCRSSDPHVRGCWVVDLVLGKG
jgi:hypothetical protein